MMWDFTFAENRTPSGLLLVSGELLFEYLDPDSILVLFQSCAILRNTILGACEKLTLGFKLPLANLDQARATILRACAIQAPKRSVTLLLARGSIPWIWYLHGGVNQLLAPDPCLAVIRKAKLQSLTLGGLAPNFLWGLTNLESLSLYNCTIESLESAPFEPLTQLTQLTMVDNTHNHHEPDRFTPEHWAAHLTNLPNLAHLTMDNLTLRYLEHFFNPSVAGITLPFRLPVPQFTRLVAGFTGLQAVHLKTVCSDYIQVLLGVPHLTTVICQQHQLDNHNNHHNNHHNEQRWAELVVNKIHVSEYVRLPLTGAAAIYAGTVVITSQPHHQASAVQLSVAVNRAGPCHSVTLDCSAEQQRGDLAAATAMLARMADALDTVALFHPTQLTVLKARGSVMLQVVQAMRHSLPISVTEVEYQECQPPTEVLGLVLPTLPVRVRCVRFVGLLEQGHATEIIRHAATHKVTIQFPSKPSGKLSKWSRGWLAEMRGQAHNLVSVESS